MRANDAAVEGEYDLAGQVIGLAMKVHRALGPGFLELVYRNALLHELKSNGMQVEVEKAIQVRYENVVVGDFNADLVVNKELLLELKAVDQLNLLHEVQIVNYLAATGMETGLLLNFGARSLEYKKKFRNFDILRRMTTQKGASSIA